MVADQFCWRCGGRKILTGVSKKVAPCRCAEKQEDELSELPDIDVKRLRLLPGDLVVVSSSETLSMESFDRLKKGLRDLLDAAGHKETRTMILQAGASVAVIGGAVTPAMIDAGADELADMEDRDHARDLVAKIYQAMLAKGAQT